MSMVQVLNERLGVPGSHPQAVYLAQRADELIDAGWPSMSIRDYESLDGASKINVARRRDHALAMVTGRRSTTRSRLSPASDDTDWLDQRGATPNELLRAALARDATVRGVENTSEFAGHGT